MKVFVYRNLHKKCWSVKALEGKDKGRVIERPFSLFLTNAEFRVSEAGRQRVIQERKKNVHAGVVGELVYETPETLEFKKVTYNPYAAGYFFEEETGTPVKNAPAVFFDVAGKVHI